MSDEIPIGPNPCSACGGEYGEHTEDCRSLAPATGYAAPVECEEAVMEKIQLRRLQGRQKYAKTMERTDLSRIQWLQHAQEEAMDLAIYLERLIREERHND